MRAARLDQPFHGTLETINLIDRRFDEENELDFLDKLALYGPYPGCKGCRHPCVVVGKKRYPQYNGEGVTIICFVGDE